MTWDSQHSSNPPPATDQNSNLPNTNWLTQNCSVLLSALFSTINSPIFVINATGIIQTTNDAAQRVLNQVDTAVLGCPLSELIPSEPLQKFILHNIPLKEIIVSEQSFAPSKSPIYDAAHTLQGWVLVLNDNGKIKKLMHSQTEFMRIASHDLRSPLTSMQGFAGMLESGMTGPINDKQKSYLGKILSGISQMSSLVDNIQDAGRYDPETGFYELLRTPTDLGESIRKIVNNYLLPVDKNLQVQVSIAPNLPIVFVDSTMLERAIANLFDNAVKYSLANGTITVSAYIHNQELVISVQDMGLGINEEDQKLLFQRYVRIARKDHKKIKGSGLGLFIVRSVAQHHQGKTWIVSTEGVGSTFFMSIPLSGANLLSSANEE